jgi:hypothetical protein
MKAKWPPFTGSWRWLYLNVVLWGSWSKLALIRIRMFFLLLMWVDGINWRPAALTEVFLPNSFKQMLRWYLKKYCSCSCYVHACLSLTIFLSLRFVITWPNLRYITSTCLEKLKKITKILVRIINVPAKIWTGHLPNTSQKYCRFTNLAHFLPHPSQFIIL